MILITLLLPIVLAVDCSISGDTACVVRNAQYTILGTVVDNSVGRGNDTAKSYDASIAVQCVWSSFVPGNVPGNGWGMADTIITVKGWGKPLPGCVNGGGADATSGTTQIFFVYIVQGELGARNAIYGVSNQCQGGIPYNTENIQIISNVLASAPASRIPKENMGTKPECILPKSNGKTGTTVSTGSGSNNYVASPSKPSLTLDPAASASLNLFSLKSLVSIGIMMLI